ncbi:hypothetical protein CQW23_00706 [Capsicum baccatum]|uniref:Retrovirus-related Pol polyprotein from transposon TNT 1-94-like beta-barrel domain-containing protein n=1 Tax=Capsicum baccatum TaxID=33114 RepID=A0A2G2XLH1_CAPBA|nr:hypothetical protein CQW23_00706 [Capsicum baccatum]
MDCRTLKKGKKKDQVNLVESKKETDDLCIMLFECNLVENPRKWWMDSGDTRHICANKELFSTFNPAQVEEKIYMANSATAKVEGTGKVYLKMTSAKVLTLSNVFGITTVDYVKSKDNVSEPLTKGLSRGVKRTSKGMGLRPRTSQHCESNGTTATMARDNKQSRCSTGEMRLRERFRMLGAGM